MHVKVVCACDEVVAEKERDKREQVHKIPVTKILYTIDMDQAIDEFLALFEPDRPAEPERQKVVRDEMQELNNDIMAS